MAPGSRALTRAPVGTRLAIMEIARPFFAIVVARVSLLMGIVMPGMRLAKSLVSLTFSDPYRLVFYFPFPSLHYTFPSRSSSAFLSACQSEVVVGKSHSFVFHSSLYDFFRENIRVCFCEASSNARLHRRKTAGATILERTSPNFPARCFASGASDCSPFFSYLLLFRYRFFKNFLYKCGDFLIKSCCLYLQLFIGGNFITLP